MRTEVLFIQEVSGAYTPPLLDTDELKMALRARKVSGAFEKRAPGEWIQKYPDSLPNSPDAVSGNKKLLIQKISG